MPINTGSHSGHLVFPSAARPVHACVVWLHGFGDDQPENWALEFRALRSSLPHVQWIHLRGEPLPQPCYHGTALPAWGAFLDDRCVTVGSRDYENEAIASNATRTEVQALLETQLSSVPRVVVGGFSMGAAVAAEAAGTLSTSSSAS